MNSLSLSTIPSVTDSLDHPSHRTYERAARAKAQAFKRAAKLNHRFTTIWVHCIAGAQLGVISGNAPAVLSHTDVLDALSSDHGIKTFEAVTRFYKGWALASSDNVENGIAFMQQGLALKEATNSMLYIPYYMSLLADAQARAGDVRSGLTLCRNAQQSIQRIEEFIWLAELHRIEGKVRRSAGHPASDVETCFEKCTRG
jgi:hypothetical protein